MTIQKKGLVLALLSSLLFASGLVLRYLRWNTEEYAVDETVIREAFSGDEVSYYVILDTTQPVYRTGISSFHSKKLGLALSTRFSYTARNVFRFHIPSNLNLPHPFKLVDQKKLDALYRPNQHGSPQPDELTGLLQRSWGVITLSRVGFDPGMTHAVIYAQLTYCGLCGEGTYLYLSKETGGWHIVGRALTWIS
jgi:hypothetical protein